MPSINYLKALLRTNLWITYTIHIDFSINIFAFCYQEADSLIKTLRNTY